MKLLFEIEKKRHGPDSQQDTVCGEQGAVNCIWTGNPRGTELL